MMWGGGWVSPPPQFIKPFSPLELPVHVAQQRGDSRAHRLVADEHHNRDCRQDQRIFRHCLATLILAHLHKHPRDLVHFPCPPSVHFFGRDWPLSPYSTGLRSHSLRRPGAEADRSAAEENLRASQLFYFAKSRLIESISRAIYIYSVISSTFLLHRRLR